MNWEVITNERSSLQEYRLIDHDDCKLVLKYNPVHQSARIISGDFHRLFFLESTGSLSGKLVFKNEYGIEVGSLVHHRYHAKEGTVVIENKQYQYQLHSDATLEMIIFSGNQHSPVATCRLPETITQTSTHLSRQASIVDNNCLLLGLCLYLFLPKPHEQLAMADANRH